MILHHCIRAACAALLVAACAVPPGDCTDTARLADLPAALDEASGIALSRRDPGILWAHNDSEGTAMLYALDRAGQLLAEIALPDAGRQFDWEDMAAGPCPAGDCLYIGDIGDNLHGRRDRAILRIPEPRLDAPRAIDVERFAFSYPDGPEDAEAIFVLPDTSVYIVTKGRRHPVTLYRYPPPLRARERVVLERVQQLSHGIAQVPDLVTAADASRDGARVAVRTYSRIMLYRFDGDTLVGPAGGTGFDVGALAEPQGEALAMAAGDTLLLATEAGPAGAQPFMARVLCPAP